MAAELNGELVGWIAGHLVQEKTIIPTASEDVIIVAEKARGRGISSTLFDRWVKRTQDEWGVKKIITATQVANERSRAIHGKRGFVETGFKTVNGLKYVEMEKRLDSNSY